MNTHRAELNLAAIARRQHRLFTYAQALEAGFSREAIRHRRIAGIWPEVDHHVMRAVTSGRVTWRERLMALTLATGGVAAGRAAAALYTLHPQAELEVVIDRARRSARHDRPEVRTTTGLDRIDIAIVDDIPSFTPARALIDLAGVLPLERMREVVDDAVTRRIVSRARLERRARDLAAPRRRGCAVILAMLRDLHPDLEQARNQWEGWMLRKIRELGLPDPIPNYAVRLPSGNRILDFGWPDLMVEAEFDGYFEHENRRTFDDDRVRQNELVAAGWRVFRFTSAWKRMPDAAFAPLARAIFDAIAAAS